MTFIGIKFHMIHFKPINSLLRIETCSLKNNYNILKILISKKIFSDHSLSLRTRIDVEHMIIREDDEKRKHGW